MLPILKENRYIYSDLISLIFVSASLSKIFRNFLYFPKNYYGRAQLASTVGDVLDRPYILLLNIPLKNGVAIRRRIHGKQQM